MGCDECGKRRRRVWMAVEARISTQVRQAGKDVEGVGGGDHSPTRTGPCPVLVTPGRGSRPVAGMRTHAESRQMGPGSGMIPSPGPFYLSGGEAVRRLDQC